jgi:hypothetical protein
MRRCRFCPKHRQQQAVMRAQVKEHITSGKLDKAHSAAVSKQSSARTIQDRPPQHKSKSEPPNDQSSPARKPSSKKAYTPLTKASPRKPSPLTSVDSKISNDSSPIKASSASTKHSRRDSPSVYARPAVLLKAQAEHNSHKKARSTVDVEASAQETPKILKEFRLMPKSFFDSSFLRQLWIITSILPYRRHASVDTQDHPCSSLLPPLMRLTSESHTNSLFHHASSLNRGSIFSSMEGAFE